MDDDPQVADAIERAIAEAGEAYTAEPLWAAGPDGDE